MDDFIDWLCCCVFEDDWDENPAFYREVILRKLTRIGKVKRVGEYYVLKAPDEDKSVETYFEY